MRKEPFLPDGIEAIEADLQADHIAPVVTAALIGGGATLLGSGLLSGGGGGGGGGGIDYGTATAPFGSKLIQGYIPGPLRKEKIYPTLNTGLGNISELLRNPGGLSPTVSQAILPRLAAESENIAANFRGIGQNQAGAAARSNLPTSIKNALAAALDIAQQRAQGTARREALTSSDQLRRQDMQEFYKLLDTLLQFSSSGRGSGITGLAAANQFNLGQQQINQQQQAALLAALGSFASSGALSNLGGGKQPQYQGPNIDPRTGAYIPPPPK